MKSMTRRSSLSRGALHTLVLAAALAGPEPSAAQEYPSKPVIIVLGLAGAGPDRAEVRGGHVHYIPKGVEHFMHNLSQTEPLEVIGIYVGAGSVEETGYVYTGEVTEADIKARTA